MIYLHVLRDFKGERECHELRAREWMTFDTIHFESWCDVDSFLKDKSIDKYHTDKDLHIVVSPRNKTGEITISSIPYSSELRRLASSIIAYQDDGTIDELKRRDDSLWIGNLFRLDDKSGRHYHA